MNELNIQSGWWVSANGQYVRCYNTSEEAIEHVKFQKTEMGSTAKWNIQYIKITFGETIKISE